MQSQSYSTLKANLERIDRAVVSLQSRGFSYDDLEVEELMQERTAALWAIVEAIDTNNR